ncbi:MAG: SPOR domain-containing protein [Pseudomonadota bacterium]
MALIFSDARTLETHGIRYFNSLKGSFKSSLLSIKRNALYSFLIIPAIISCFTPPVLRAANAGQVFSIQVGAFTDLQYALNEIDRFKRTGRDAFHNYETTKQKERYYRVYIGKYGSRVEAEKEARKFKKLGLISGYQIRALNLKELGKLENNNDKTNLSNRKSSPSQKKEATADHPQNQPQQTGKRVIKDTDSPHPIDDIRFEANKGEKETVFIRSNRYLSPSVLFTHKGKGPRLIIEIKDITTLRKDLAKIPVNGEWIKQIRTELHRESNSLKIILELHPNENYGVRQISDRVENVYALEISTQNSFPDLQQQDGPKGTDTVKQEG